MSHRLTPLTAPEHEALMADLRDMECRMFDLVDRIGDAYGARWTDRALKALRAIERLTMQVGDKAP